jgi:hypothetical protein
LILSTAVILLCGCDKTKKTEAIPAVQRFANALTVESIQIAENTTRLRVLRQHADDSRVITEAIVQREREVVSFLPTPVAWGDAQHVDTTFFAPVHLGLSDDELTVNIVMSRGGRLTLTNHADEKGKEINLDELRKLFADVANERSVAIIEVELPAHSDVFLNVLKAASHARKIAVVPMGCNPVKTHEIEVAE